MARKGMQIAIDPGLVIRPCRPRGPRRSGPGRARKIAMLGGAWISLKHAPWHDESWELWSHHSCRNACIREPDVYFDMHPPELWRDPTKKFWDRKYLVWTAQNRVPIYMQDRYSDVPASMKYPFARIITEFPRGYMTNTMAYMMALALTEGVTHIGVFGCNYSAGSEYGPQRGCAEYWLGIAEGRGVHVCIPHGCDLLNKPSLLYGYESHPGGVRDKSYSFGIGIKTPPALGEPSKATETVDNLIPADHPNAPPLRNIGVPPALHRRDGVFTGE